MAPTNVYFDTGTQSEQDLYEAIAIEQIKIQKKVFKIDYKVINKKHQVQQVVVQVVVRLVEVDTKKYCILE